MPNIIIVVGPPGCGKSIWASLYVENHKAKRLNRDDFRSSMQNGKYTDFDEKVIKRIRNYAVESWLQTGYDVVVDDTNLTPDVFPEMQRIARRVGDTGVREHVINTERGVCWYNNTHRSKGVVPEQDWNKLWLLYTHYQKHDEYFAPPRQIQTEMYLNEYHDSELPHCVIVDLDETLALHPYRRDPYDHSNIPNDLPNMPLVDTLHRSEDAIIIVTGRSEISKDATEDWLAKHGIEYDHLYMRSKDEETEHDFKIKKDIYDRYIKDKYFVTAVYEDRERLVELWRDLGLFVYQVIFGRY